MKPIIGIICRHELIDNREIVFLFDKYRKAMLFYGAIPLLITPPQIADYFTTKGPDIGHLTNSDKEILNRQLELCDGILMPGGDKCFDYDKYICEYANKFNIPILGICMGMQIMCNYDNDNSNIKNDNESHKQPEEDIVHEVIINSDSILYDIIKEKKIMVNSNHNYHVKNSGSYKISALSDDNLIEGIEKEGVFNIGLQWHPEKTYQDEFSKRLFKAFVHASRSKNLE